MGHSGKWQKQGFLYIFLTTVLTFVFSRSPTWCKCQTTTMVTSYKLAEQGKVGVPLQ
jgi:hypothetical protein